jgi:hypothetical protein
MVRFVSMEGFPLLMDAVVVLLVATFVREDLWCIVQ